MLNSGMSGECATKTCPQPSLRRLTSGFWQLVLPITYDYPWLMTNPIRPTDDDARTTARNLMASAGFCAIATLDQAGAPVTARIAFGQASSGHPVSLISTLSNHTQALMRDPRASLLVGEPAGKGDPLTHPRLTLQANAVMIPRDAREFTDLRTGWLTRHPKSKLYIDFSDFLFARFDVTGAFLNGGFGKAFNLTPQDLGLVP